MILLIWREHGIWRFELGQCLRHSGPSSAGKCFQPGKSRCCRKIRLLARWRLLLVVEPGLEPALQECWLSWELTSLLPAGNDTRHTQMLRYFEVCICWLCPANLIKQSALCCCPIWARGNPPSYPFTSPPFNLSFSISYFSSFSFLTCFIYFLAFPSLPILPE